MRLRTRFDLFSAALLSALGATPVVACGGSARFSAGNPGGSDGAGAGNSAASAASNGGAEAAGSGQSGAATAGTDAATAGNAASAGAATGPDANPNRYPCANPHGAWKGFEECDGFRHRTEVQTCTAHLPRPEPTPGVGPVQCRFDTDCKDKPYGWCSPGITEGPSCQYGCVTDSDCAGNEICECGELVGACVQADCVSDADCQDGFLCRSYDASGGCGPTLYACQSAADACGSLADCNSGDSKPAQCRFDAEAHGFQCFSGSCIPGRPFLVEGAQRLAAVAARADWLELAQLAQVTDLEPTLRSRLAEHWTRSALMEHASIAAFARFTLQLMSVAAPAELIERATAAMADETQHAKACFTLASGYAGAPLGPGPLVVEGSLDESSWQAIVLNTIREGCVGETVAAIEAREAAEHAADPALRQLLLRISEDETRHAELAYRFVQWALAASGPELERAVRQEFAELAALAAPVQSTLAGVDHALLEHGVVPGALRAAIRGRVISEVILPCSRALFRSEARTSQLANVSA